VKSISCQRFADRFGCVTFVETNYSGMCVGKLLKDVSSIEEETAQRNELRCWHLKHFTRAITT